MKEKGFTLVEMVIALAVIAILLGVTYPSLVNYGRNAKEIERSRLENIINKALRQYYALEGSYPSNVTYNMSDTIEVDGKNAYRITEAGLDSLADTLLSKAGPVIHKNGIDYGGYKYYYVPGSGPEFKIAVRF